MKENPNSKKNYNKIQWNLKPPKEDILSVIKRIEDEKKNKLENKLAMENYTKNVQEQNKIKKENRERSIKRNRIGCFVISVFLIIIYIIIF